MNKVAEYFGTIRVKLAIQKRSYEPINKTNTKNEAKRLRASTFALKFGRAKNK